MKKLFLSLLLAPIGLYSQTKAFDPDYFFGEIQFGLNYSNLSTAFSFPGRGNGGLGVDLSGYYFSNDAEKRAFFFKPFFNYTHSSDVNWSEGISGSGYTVQHGNVDVFSGGLELGYRYMFSRYFGLEASIGFGYADLHVSADYSWYDAGDDGAFYLDDSFRSGSSTTARIAIVSNIGNSDHPHPIQLGYNFGGKVIQPSYYLSISFPFQIHRD